MALVVVAAALVHLDWILYEFSVDTAALPPGSGIRPMGPAFHIFYAAACSILGGGFCSLAGIVVGVGQRRLSVVLAALATLGLCVAPWFVGFRAFNQIIAARKLVIEP